MALQQNIYSTNDPPFYIGSDYTLRCRYLDGAVPVDMAGATLSWMLKKRKKDPDEDAFIEKTTADGISLIGAFDADPTRNEQRIYVTIAAADTNAYGSPAAALAAGSYWHELKRMDAGQETVLLEGTCRLMQGVHHT